MNQQITLDVPVKPHWSSMQRQAFKPSVTLVRPLIPELGWSGASTLPLILETTGDRVAECNKAGTLRVAVDESTFCLRVEIQSETPYAAPEAEPGSGAFWQQDLVELRLLLSDDGEMLQVGLGASGAAWDNLGLLEDPAKLRATPLDIPGGWGLEVRIDLNALGLPSPSHDRPLDLYGLVAPTITINGVRALCAQSPTEQAFSQFERFGIFRLVTNQAALAPAVLKSITPQTDALWSGTNTFSLCLHSLSDTTITARLHIEHECGNGDTFNHTTPVTLSPNSRENVSVNVQLGHRAYTRINFYLQSGTERYLLGSVSLRGMPYSDNLQIDPSTLKHPYLLCAPENLARIHHSRQTYGAAAAPHPEQMKKKKKQKEKPLIPKLNAAMNKVFTACIDSKDLTDLEEVKRLAKEIADKEIRIGPEEKDPQGFGGHLSMGMQLGNYALAYDAVVSHVDKETARVLQKVGANLLDIFIEQARDRAWWCTTNANANTVNNANAGTLALALLGECPQAVTALQLACRWIWRHLDYCQGPDGGNTEGVQYWEYGTMYLLSFGAMLESVTNTDNGILSHPSIVNLTNMIRLALCPDGGMHGMNDTIPVPLGTRMAYFAASRYGDELGLWYGDHAREWWQRELAKGRKLPDYNAGPWADFFRPHRPAIKEAPPFPTAFMLESIQYATLRSAPRFDCKWMAGLKGQRAPYTHHAQRDSGAICIHLRGERLLIDPGYYLPYPEEHCLPIIDGQGPDKPGDFPGRIERCEDHGDYRVVSCDSTAAYGDSAKRVRRVMMMWDDGPVVWLDDIIPSGDGKISAYYQCGATPSMTDRKPQWTIKGQKAEMQIDLLGASVTTLNQHEQRKLTKWGYCFAECEMHPISAEYCTTDAKTPLISVCQDATEAAIESPTLKPVDYGFIIELSDGHYARFCQKDDRWIVADAGTRLSNQRNDSH